MGRFTLTFEGAWTETTMWELYALAILDELKTRAQLKTLSEFGLDILYARAKTKLWSKIERLRGVPGLSVADFGTRRRHSFLWQEYVVSAMASNLGTTSSAHQMPFWRINTIWKRLARMRTRIPMVMAALAPDDVALKASQYRVLELWQQTYEGALKVMLPDTFGTTQFLAGAPEWVADWTGQRVDSKNPYVAGDEYIAWLKAHGRDATREVADCLRYAGRGHNPRAARVFWRDTGKGIGPADFHSAADFADCEQVDAGPARAGERRMGNTAHQ